MQLWQNKSWGCKGEISVFSGSKLQSDFSPLVAAAVTRVENGLKRCGDARAVLDIVK